MTELADRLSATLAGRYAIQRELGAGGMATVFLAHDLRHRRAVAIKVLHPELTAVLGSERFLREIEIAAGLTHPHILPLHDSGAADGLLYYVMPYAEGESLRHRLKREPQLPLADALRIARETADALDYAHRHGVVHRDIKPENILLAEQHAVVADFGIARAVAVAGGETLTSTGTVIGTPGYMSPEQCLGGRELDGRSDQYSLGCVLYEMLAGQPPFMGPTAESLAHQHLSLPPRPVTALRTAVPDGVERAVARALAKTAADRFASAAEFATAIMTGGDPEGVGAAYLSGVPRAEDARQAAVDLETVPMIRPRRPRALPAAVIVAAVVGIASLVSVAAWQRWGPFASWLGGSRSAHVVQKQWVLVAEFDAPPGDSLLAVATHDLVSAALDQSEIVATVPREQVRLALQMAGMPTRTRVDAELAKELAYRSAVRTVVEGTIGRLGHGYSVVLRVVDAESLRVVLTERAVAKNEDALIPTLGRLAEKLRAGLGEKRASIQATRPLMEAATPSLEAYRLFLQGLHLGLNNKERDALPVLREAIALDPDFAHAWAVVATNLNNLGELDSALAAYNEALRRPNRLTRVQWLSIEAGRAGLEGDAQADLAAIDRALQVDRFSPGLLGSRGFVLGGLGRFEEALESTRKAMQFNSFGPTQYDWNNLVVNLCSLGRVDEAREVARHISGRVPNAIMRLFIEVHANNWPSVERIADTLLTDPHLAEYDLANALTNLATAQSARGALKTAATTFERSEAVAVAGALTTDLLNDPRRARLMLSVISAGAIPLLGDAWARDSSTVTLVTRGLRATVAGDAASAQRFLDAARAHWAHSRRELAWQGAAPALLEARIEALAGRWGGAARILRPAAAQRVEIGVRVPGRAGMSMIRWFLADAFEQLDQPDSAAVTLERVTSDPAPAQWEGHTRGILLPFAHRRLVLLYARMGRVEDARRHWKIFTETVRTPDPELQPLIAQARDALARAEGMARPARR